MQMFGADASSAKIREHVAQMSDFALHSLCCDGRFRGALDRLKLPSEAVLQSGKAQRLAALLPEIQARGGRVLIFSQARRLLPCPPYLPCIWDAAASLPVQSRRSSARSIPSQLRRCPHLRIAIPAHAVAFEPCQPACHQHAP